MTMDHIESITTDCPIEAHRLLRELAKSKDRFLLESTVEIEDNSIEIDDLWIHRYTAKGFLL